MTAPRRSLVVPCPLTWHRGRSLVVPCPLTWHRGAAAFFWQRIGVAADAATRAECHVNGHGTTTRPHPLTCLSRRSLVEGKALAKRNVAVIHRPPGALPPFQTFALTARCERAPLPGASLPTVACRRAMNSPSCGGRGMAFSHPAPQTAL